MRLAVLDVCVWLEEYQSGQPRFGEVLSVWLRRAVPEAQITVLNIGEGAPLPVADAFDGYLLGGSEKGVYDDAPWMAPLRQFLQDVRRAGRPVFGICFGHQIMADVYGGKAEYLGAAEVGVRHFEIDGLFVTGHVWHQDQVTQVPPGAQVIGSADYCPVAALAYEFPAMSVQFHPEYSAEYVADFLARSRGEVLSAEETDAALAQFSRSDVQADLFADRAGAFFRDAYAARVKS
ncbi:type 1 glutamine amidotransferase [Aliishimia ponticola]|uniref:Type 1 glutamine amidotransferase n=1 Tax=Aliishimia ponticola TaxID=2499833 RepID=A0A4S4NCE4_9RHOB|nr:type 1 glutamine amidotransferase [Aliishimia ponticola]THH37049.1 type 1 glutamine amidotransferase [Aliishimia ponticola]